MSSAKDFKFGEIIVDGSEIARKNWDRMQEHAVAEWSGDLEATMATVSRNEPFQIFHGTGTVIRGWDAVYEFYKERLTVFSGQGFFADHFIVTDRYIAAEGHFKGSPKGMFFGTMTYGRPLHLPFSLWIHCENTFIKGEVAYFDGAELQRQIDGGAPRTPPG